MSDINVNKIPAKTADETPQPLVIQQITVRPINRQSQDLTNWRNGTKAAEATVPRRVILYDLYRDVETTDGHIIAVWGKREDAVTSAEWIYTDKEGNSVDEINQVIDSIGFEDLLKLIVGSKKDGYRMGEASFFINDNDQHEMTLYDVPLKHMRPDKGIVTFEQTGDHGLNIREGIYAKTVIEVGKPDDLGLLLAAAKYAILKRGDESDWAEFIEIFGRGIIDAQWDGFDENQRIQLAQALSEMGGGGIIIRPAGTQIEIKQNTGNASGDLQEKFANYCNKEISKALLGSTETTESSSTSGYAQAETHSKQDIKKNETDINFTRRILNSRFIKILKAAGFNTNGGTFTLKSEKQLSKKEAFEIHSKMAKELNLPIDDDFFYEEYEMPKPKDYDAQKKAKAELPEPPTFPDDRIDPSVPKKAKKSKDVKLSDRSLLRKLSDFFTVAPAAMTGASKQLAEICCGNHLTKLVLPLQGAGGLSEDDLIQRFYDAGGSLSFDLGLFNYTADTLFKGFNKGLNSPVKGHGINLAFTYGVDDPATLTAYEMNLFRFAGCKTIYQAQELNRLFRKSKSFTEFKDAASALLKIHNGLWLEAEYNTAVATGESAATYARLLKQVDIFPYWCYKTVQDDKVRHAHMLLHDIVLKWDHPAWKFILPPNDWNCRCFIVPRAKQEVTKEQLAESETKVNAYLDSEAFKKAVKGGWGINRADKGEVFTENQHYTKDYLDAMTSLDKLSIKDYKLQDIETIIKERNLAPFKPKFKESERDEAVNDFIESLEVSSKRKYVIPDINNRPVYITKSTVSSHTTDKLTKYKTRHMLLNELKNVLKAPNEMWLNKYKTDELNNYTYIKYYKDEALVVIARLKDNLSLEIESWFKMDSADLRKGLLVLNNKPK